MPLGRSPSCAALDRPPIFSDSIADEAIKATLPLGSTAYEAKSTANGERLIWLDARVVNRLAAMRGPGERYSES